jgi:hypothetical protein
LSALLCILLLLQPSVDLNIVDHVEARGVRLVRLQILLDGRELDLLHLKLGFDRA